MKQQADALADAMSQLLDAMDDPEATQADAEYVKGVLRNVHEASGVAWHLATKMRAGRDRSSERHNALRGRAREAVQRREQAPREPRGGAERRQR